MKFPLVTQKRSGWSKHGPSISYLLNSNKVFLALGWSGWSKWSKYFYKLVNLYNAMNSIAHQIQQLANLHKCLDYLDHPDQAFIHAI